MTFFHQQNWHLIKSAWSFRSGIGVLFGKPQFTVKMIKANQPKKRREPTQKTLEFNLHARKVNTLSFSYSLLTNLTLEELKETITRFVKLSTAIGIDQFCKYAQDYWSGQGEVGVVCQKFIYLRLKQENPNIDKPTKVTLKEEKEDV